MKIYLSVDLEGIYGVNKYDTGNYSNKNYKKWKKYVASLMKDEVEAVISGLLSIGAKQITVFDSHGGGDTLNVDSSQNIFIASHNLEKTTLPCLDNTYDGIILWGYHVKSGSKEGKLSHTYSRRIKKFLLNGIEVGEAYLHSLIAHHYNIPLITASGDSALVNEIHNDFAKISLFNSDLGNNMERGDYLAKIKSYISNLDLDNIKKESELINWPKNTTLQITYKSSIVNISRWIIRKQYRCSKLISPWTIIYDEYPFPLQFDLFAGLKKQ